MSLSRLRNRVSSAIRIGVFTLDEHSLRFHKISNKDGSGKCDAFYTNNPKDYMIGSLFEINENDKKKLDKIEGVGYGYEIKIVQVYNKPGEIHEAFTYYATNINESLKPYSWYHDHVIVGAKETGVPDGYLKDIQAIESIRDPNKSRDRQERAIYRQLLS